MTMISYYVQQMLADKIYKNTLFLQIQFWNVFNHKKISFVLKQTSHDLYRLHDRQHLETPKINVIMFTKTEIIIKGKMIILKAAEQRSSFFLLILINHQIFLVISTRICEKVIYGSMVIKMQPPEIKIHDILEGSFGIRQWNTYLNVQ